jgi:DNA-binding GntR family transcriptional regulator
MSENSDSRSEFEETYVCKTNEELVAALRTQDVAARELAIRQHVRMRCPKWGASLQAFPYRRITVDAGAGCYGI